MDAGSEQLASADDRFQAVRPLGQGGFADVSLAHDSLLDRQVVLKQLRRDRLSQEEFDDILREAKVNARVSHPNLVQVYDVVSLDAIPTIVMEFVDGESLKIAAADTSWGAIDRLMALISVCDGLRSLHEAGIAHGDVRPENVLRSKGGEIKVADFGVSVTHTDHGDDSEAARPKSSLDDAIAADIEALNSLVMYLVPMQFRTSVFSRAVPVMKRATTVDDVAVNLRTILNDAQHAETVPPTVKTRFTRMEQVFIGGAIAAMAALFAFVVYMPGESGAATSRIHIEPLELTDQVGLSEEQRSMIEVTVQAALEAAVLGSANLVLVRDFEVPESYQLESFEIDPTVAPVDRVITPVASCNRQQCSLYLDTQRLGISRVEQTSSTPFVADGSETLYYLTQYLLRQTGLQLSSDTAKEVISAKDLLEYNDLYQSAYVSGDTCQELMPRIEQLKQRAPDFPLALYLGLYCALEAFNESGDANGIATHTADLTDYIFRNPDASTSNYELLIKAYSEQGDFESAELALNNAEKSNPDWWSLTQWRADLLSRRGEYDAAIRLYEELLSVFPSRQIFGSTAINYYYAGRITEATQLAERSLDVYPGNAKTLNFLGMMYLNSGRAQEAISSFEQAISLRNQLLYRNNLGLAYMLDGDWSSAADIFRSLISSGEGSPTIILNLADTLTLQGRPEEASFYYREATNGVDEHSTIEHQTTRAQALAQLGEHRAAIEYVRYLRDRFGPVPEVSYAAATVYAVSGEMQSALSALEEALSNGYNAIWFSFPWFEPLCELAGLSAGTKAHLPCDSHHSISER